MSVNDIARVVVKTRVFIKSPEIWPELDAEWPLHDVLFVVVNGSFLELKVSI